MIIFLYGEDTYRIKEKTKEIIESYKKVHKSGLNFRILDFSGKKSESGQLEDFKISARQASMFEEKKLIVAISPTNDTDFKNQILDNFEVFNNSNDLFVLVENCDPDKRDKLFKKLKGFAKCQEFAPLSGQKLVNWIENRFKENGCVISSQIALTLISRAGNDLWRLNCEIGKLSNYKKGKEINEKDIDILVASKTETDIFKTIDAIAAKNKKLALSYLREHLEKGDNPIYMLSMINYQFRNLLILKDLVEKRNSYDAILRKSRLHPFVIKKSMGALSAFAQGDLKKIYQKIFQTDLNIKTGRVDPVLGVELLISEM